MSIRLQSGALIKVRKAILTHNENVDEANKLMVIRFEGPKKSVLKRSIVGNISSFNAVIKEQQDK